MKITRFNGIYDFNGDIALSIEQVVLFYDWLRKKYGAIKPLEEAMIVNKVATKEEVVKIYISEKLSEDMKNL